jgi:hypothetical protein
MAGNVAIFEVDSLMRVVQSGAESNVSYGGICWYYLMYNVIAEASH